MRLTVYTDYALRTLMYLAVLGDRPATIAGIAATYGISEAHLTKIVHGLARTGDIVTTRGRGGGLRLGRAAERINLGAVVRHTEADLQLVPCFGDRAQCRIEAACILSGALREAMDAFLAVLDRYSLADLVAPRQRLATVLGIDLSAPEAV